MKINNSNISFKGYDARPLKYLVMRDTNILKTKPVAKELEEIGKKHGFQVLFDGYELLDKVPSDNFNSRMTFPWLQDVVHFMKNKIITSPDNTNTPKNLKNFFDKEIESVPLSEFVKGGNLYFIKLGEKEKILVGKDDCLKAMKLFKRNEITQIPQADFHIDLFIRPLKDGKILVADDRMTLNILKNARKNLEKEDDLSINETLMRLDYIIEGMEDVIKTGKSTKSVIKKLEKEGYKPIRVPGRIVRDSEVGNLKNIMNFMNAIVHENPDGDLVYITNNSSFVDGLHLDKNLAKKVGLDIKENFINAIKNYIKPENIYFVKGGQNFEEDIEFILRTQDGGIHCLTAEVPL